jgi:hypothetical protein
MKINILPKVDLYVEMEYEGHEVQVCVYDIEDVCDMDILSGQQFTEVELNDILGDIYEAYKKI